MKANKSMLHLLLCGALAGCGSSDSANPRASSTGTGVQARSGDADVVSARAGELAARYYLSLAGQLLTAPGITSGMVTLGSAGGVNHDGGPYQATTLVVRGLQGSYSGGATQFSLPLDAGVAVGTGTQARVSYDFEGDGQVDRQETYAYFANNNAPGWEIYRETRGTRSVSGAMRDFRNGTVQLEVWNAIGRAPVNLRLDDASAYLDVPISGTAPAPVPSPTSSPAVGGTLYPNPSGLSGQPATGQLTVPSADGINHDGTPYRALTLQANGLTGRYTGASTAFQFLLDAGTQVACATQVRLSYDFDGNGTADRVETYQYFPTNNSSGWENYTQASQLRSASGTWADFRGGSLTVEIWNALGRGPTLLGLDGSRLDLPISSAPAAPTPSPSPTTSPSPSPTGWVLTWGEEFNGPNGTRPDASKWNYQLGGNGYGNNEQQTYTDRLENLRVEDGHLIIEARKENLTGGDGIPRSFTSGRLKTVGKFSQQYGKFEARIKIPAGQGIWPAFWMMGADKDLVGWPACGEIDIMENIGREPATVHGTAHGPGYSGGSGIGSPYQLPAGQRFSDDYHVFSVEWKPNWIQWKVDGNVYHTLTPDRLPAGAPWAFNKPFFVLLNVAVGGAWPGYPDASTVFPQRMEVDYLRVYSPQ